MARSLAQPLRIENSYLEFGNSSGRVPGVAPSGRTRLYYDPAQGFMLSVSGGSYGSVTGFTGGSALTVSAGGTVSITADDAASALVRLGRGLPLGAPSGTPTAATNGAGGLTGDYKYAYSETSSEGESSLSPASDTVTASSNTIRVVVPYHRRGTSSRKLYRAKGPGFSTWNLVHDFGGANGFHQSTWDDNTADGSVGAAHSGTDTSKLWEFEANARVKYFRTHPDQTTEPGDVTVLTSDADSGFAIDAYGPTLFRTRTGNSLASQKTGTAGTHIYAEWLDDVDTGGAATNVFNIFARGEIQSVPLQLTESRPALAITTTMPTVITANRFAITVGVTGAGSSSFEQQGFRVDWAAGYTGTSPVRGIASQMSSAHSGSAYAIWGSATAAATRNYGVVGNAAGGTNNWGGFFGLNQAPDGFGTASAALGCSTNTTDDAFRAYDAGSLVFQIRDGGHLNLAATSESGGGVNTGDFFRGSTQAAFFTRLGGTTMTFPTVPGTSSATATVADTTTETSVIGTLVGTKTLGANFFIAGKSVRLRVWGHVSTTGTPNLTILMKLGSTTITSTGAVATGNNLSSVFWTWDGIITCRTTGASGTVFGQGLFHVGTAAAMAHWPAVTTAAVTIDTTASQVLDLTATWGTQSASNTISGTNFSTEILN